MNVTITKSISQNHSLYSGLVLSLKYVPTGLNILYYGGQMTIIGFGKRMVDHCLIRLI